MNDLMQKIHDLLKSTQFDGPDDLVDVSDGGDDSIHLVVVSRKLDGLGWKEKNDLIWNVLTSHLTPDEWGLISLTIATTPEEIKAS